MTDGNQPREGAPRRNKNAKKHGVNTLKVVLKDVGLGGIARTTVAGRELARRLDQIIADAGGKDDCSELKLGQMRRYVTNELLIDTVDGWVFRQRSIFVGRSSRKLLLPILAERARLIDQNLKIAVVLGLDRKSASAPDLSSYIKEKESARQRAEQKGTADHVKGPAVPLTVPPTADPDQPQETDSAAVSISAPSVDSEQQQQESQP